MTIQATPRVDLALGGDYVTKVMADSPYAFWRFNDREGYAQAVLADVPIGYWRLGDAAYPSLSASDSSGNALTALAVSDGTNLFPNQSGALSDGNRATNFIGVIDGRYDVADNALLHLAVTITVEMWFYIESATTGSLRRVVRIGGTAGATISTRFNGGQITATFNVGGVDTSVSYVGAAETDRWHHVVATYDGANVSIYRDGVLGGAQAPVVGALNVGAIGFRIGGDTAGLNHIGGLDEICIYGYALSAEQVANHYALRTSTITTLSAPVFLDSSGNARNGTIAKGVQMFTSPEFLADGDKSLRFDGFTGLATINVAIATGTTCTFVFWFTPDSTQALGYGGLVSDLGDNNGLFYYRPTRKLSMFFGSADHFSNTALTDGVSYCIGVSIAGGNGTFYVNGVADGTFSGFTSFNFRYMGGIIDSLRGYLDDAIFFTTALSGATLLSYYLARLWTDVTADVIVTNGLSIRYGISGGSPNDRVASSGECRLVLNDSQTNSAHLLGYYSPNNANCLTGFTVGIPMRVSLTYNGVTYYKFVGRLKDIRPQAGRYVERLTTCTATDYVDDLARANLKIAAQLNKRQDELLTTLLAAMPTQPYATGLETGIDSFPYAFVGSAGGIINALSECQRIAMSELGYIYVKGNTTGGGVLVAENRHTRQANVTNSVSFNETMVDLEVPSSIDDLLNNVQVTIHPRRVDTVPVVLYATVSTFQLSPGQSLTIFGPYRDPTQQAARVGGASMVAPVATTDYIANSQTDGLGLDLTANVTVVATFGGNGVSFLVTNTSMTTGCFLTRLQCRGLGLYDFDNQILIAEDTVSETRYGVNVKPIDMSYQSDPNIGDGAGKWMLSLWGNPFALARSITFVAERSAALMVSALTLEPGARIGITETVTGISTVISGSSVSRGFFVNGVELSLMPGITTCKLTLSPGDNVAYWILEQVGSSELDSTTVLGFI